jgi:hypothetical protein
MKAKTINKILTGKFIAWTKSIEDETVRKQVEENSIITGGSIVSLLLNEEVSDFDVYFRTPEAAYAVAEYYVKKLLENPPPTFKDTPEHKVEISAKLEPAIPEGKEEMRIGGAVKGPVPARVRVVVKSAGVAGAESKQTDYQYFEGLGTDQSAAVATDEYVSNALGQPEGYAEGQVGDTSEPDAYVKNVTELDDVPAEELLKDGVKPDGGKRTKFRVLFVTSNAITLSDQMQLVLRFQGEVDEIHKNYDFVHCTSSWTSWDKRLTLRPEALEAILTKELKYIGSKYPICSLIRTRKFITRGWTINAGQYVKMAYQVSKLDLDSASVLEDQLVGVDSAYFNQLISELREKASGDRVDATYLMTLIDKIF